MKRTLVLAVIILAVIGFIAYRAKATMESGSITAEIYAKPPEFKKIDIPIKKLLAEPKDGSKTVYEIPMSVRILAVTHDKKWYKTRISYNFLGHFQAEGWVKVE